MKRPAIQLYFGDLLKNPNVLRCSWGARGALIWTMSLLHDSDEYGAVRWTLTEIAQAVGCPLPLIKELVAKGPLKGSDKHVDAYRWAPSHGGKRGPEVELVPEQDGPLWYSSRMVRDEYKRTNRGLGTRFGSPGKLSTGTPTPPPNNTPTRANGDAKGSENGTPTQREGDGASSSSSSNPNEVRSESPTKSPARVSKANGDHKNGLENQQRNATSAWRTDDQAAITKAASLNIKPNPGEGWAALRARIDQAQADKDRQRS